MAFTKSLDHNQSPGGQRARLPVKDGDSGTGSKTINLAISARDLVLSNDSTTDNLTFKVTGPDGDFTFVLKAGDVLDERFSSFIKIEITAIGDWRCYWRSGELV